MIHLILVSHGSLASGILEAGEMILGKQSHVSVFGLYPGESADLFLERLEQEINEISNPGNTLILSDIPIGTPANMANVMALKKGITSVSGMNLPMLLEVLSMREEESLEDVVKCSLETGKESIRKGV